MKTILCIMGLLFCQLSIAQNTDENAIRNILEQQVNAWNKGDVRSFMEGYWKNDSLVYIGKNGPTYGFQKTLNNYQKNYPDSNFMGKLKFTLLSLKPLGADYYFVIGKWELTRKVGNLGGHYTLIFKRINGQWNIIADHSS